MDATVAGMPQAGDERSGAPSDPIPPEPSVADLYRSLVAASPDDIVVTDLRGVIRSISPAGVAMFRLASAEEAVGAPLTDYIAPEDRERTVRDVMDVLAGRRTGHRRYRGLRPDGTTFDIEASGVTVRTAEGEPTGFLFVVRDVTEPLRAEAALVAREAELAEAQGVGKTGSFTWDAVTDAATWSPGLRALYGFPDETTPARFQEIGRYLPPASADAVTAAMERMAVSGEPWELEHEYVRADGTTGWVLVRVQPVVGTDGEVTGVRGTQTDVTDLKRAERALHESEELYRSIVAVSPDTIALTTLDGVLTFFSPSGVRIFGLAGPEDALGRRITDFIAPEDRARVVAGLGGRLSGGWIGPEVYRALRADGSRFEIEVNGVPRRDAAGEIVGFVFVVRDVTERRRAEEALRLSEERHRLIAENALDVVWTMAPDGRITSLSPSVERLRGYTVEEAMVQSLEEIHAPGSVEKSLSGLGAIVSEAAAGRVPAPFRDELEYRCKDGSTVWCDVMAHAVLAADGSLVEILGVSRDISERKRTEAALIAARDAAEAARADLAQAQRIAHVGSWAWDPVADVTSWSEEFRRILGLPLDAPGPSAVEARERVYTPESWERLAPALERAMTTGEPYTVDVDMYRADGTVVHAVARGEAVRGPDGAVRMLRGTIADVSEQRRAQEALRARDALSMAVIQGTADVVYVKDPDGKMLLMNEPAARMVGRPPEAFIGLDERSWFPPDLAETIIATDLGVLASGEAVTLEEEVADKDGVRHIFLSNKSRLLGADGTTIGLLAVGRDITDRRLMEEALREREAGLREAQHIAHVGSWTLFPDGGGRDTWSDEMFRLHGLDPAEGVPSLREYARFTSSADFARIRSFTRRCLEQGEPYEIEHEIRAADGVVRHIRSRAAAILGADGRVVGISGTHQDVTAEHDLEERLRQAQRLEAVGQLAGGVAHDFNNLLAALRGNTELARDSLPADSPARSDLDEALLVADRAALLTRQLLAFSRRQPLHPEVVDPADVVDALVPMLRRLLGEHIELTTARGPDLGFVRVDPGHLEQVILNLVVNARDAMPDGGRLRIGLENATSTTIGRRTDEPERAASVERPCVRIVVTDTGTGIDPAVLPRIFEPFFTTKQVGEGSGMGLATVYGVVAASGGSIAATSDPGRGTTFTIDLPTVSPAEVAIAEEAAGAVSAAVAGGETVILVEDEAAVRRVLARMLRGFGYVVIEAGGPAEALALGESVLGSADALVTDVIMPGMSGPRLADVVAERLGRPMPTVLVSGYAPDPTLAARLELPGTAFVAKPFDGATLAAALRKAVEGR